MDASNGAGDGAARHLIGWFSERGPGDALGPRSIDWLSLGCDTADAGKGEFCQPDDLRASSPTRAWGHLTVNGNAGEFHDTYVDVDKKHANWGHVCLACFFPGVDVVLPPPADGGECPECQSAADVWRVRKKEDGDADAIPADAVAAYEAKAGTPPYAPHVVDGMADTRKWLAFWQGRAGTNADAHGHERGVMWLHFKCDHPQAGLPLFSTFHRVILQSKHQYGSRIIMTANMVHA
jgi:hypothetical protein